jgi:hypothetical protein
VNPSVRTVSIVQDLEQALWSRIEELGVRKRVFVDAGWRTGKLGCYKGLDPPCIRRLLEGTREGLRHDSAIRLFSYFMNFRGEKSKKVFERMKTWNECNAPPLEEEELQDIFGDVAKGSYNYGCTDTLFRCACIQGECEIGANKISAEAIENKEHSQQIVQKLWNYCNVLRDDGLSYGDYVEQLTYLLFLKMADEQTKPPLNKPSRIPSGSDWTSLIELDGTELELHYRNVLETLGKEKGLLGVIFRKAQNKIQDPAKLRRLIVDLIDREQWITLDADVKGDAYEGLLEKNAEDVKGGAGEYFTPRPLIKAIVDVMRPAPGMTIFDPACGTGGFLLAAHFRPR